MIRIDFPNERAYVARVTGVYDGDTITVDIDLGFGSVLKEQKIRLRGINTPELRGDTIEAGRAARDWLRHRILDTTIRLSTWRDEQGKFGRWLGVVWVGGLNMNEELIEAGHAVPFME